MALVLIAAPSGEPVTVDDAKEYLRVTIGDDDPLIESLLKAARQSLDGRDGSLGRALLPQTWELRLDRFPCGSARPWATWIEAVSIVVPLPPLVSVTSIIYVDSNGTPQTLATSEYTVITGEEPGRIEPAYGKYWPAARRQSEAVKVRFIAGYTDENAVPEGIRTGIKALAAHFYENREPVGPSLAPLPMHIDALLAPYRIYGAVNV